MGPKEEKQKEEKPKEEKPKNLVAAEAADAAKAEADDAAEKEKFECLANLYDYASKNLEKLSLSGKQSVNWITKHAMARLKEAVINAKNGETGVLSIEDVCYHLTIDIDWVIWEGKKSQ